MGRKDLTDEVFVDLVSEEDLPAAGMYPGSFNGRNRVSAVLRD